MLYLGKADEGNAEEVCEEQRAVNRLFRGHDLEWSKKVVTDAKYMVPKM